MKFLMRLLLAGTAIVSASFIPAELPIGAAIPMANQQMVDVRGGSITLKQAMKENGLLVMFSCNTCPYVVRNQGRTLSAGKAALQKKIGVILINSNEDLRTEDDSFAAMKQYAKTQGYQWPYVVDEGSKLADAFGAKRTPECYLFNREGKLVYQGAIDDNPTNASAVKRHHLSVAMDEMVAGKAVSQTQTRSVGCAIKRKS